MKTELLNLITEIEIARGIILQKTHAKYFYKRLIEDKATVEQMQTARLWILRGDWTGRHGKFYYSDFWPTEKQLGTIASVQVKTAEQIAEIRRQEYERGYRDGEAASAKQRDILKTSIEQENLLKKNAELHKEVFALKEELRDKTTELINTQTALSETQRIQHGNSSSNNLT